MVAATGEGAAGWPPPPPPLPTTKGPSRLQTQVLEQPSLLSLLALASGRERGSRFRGLGGEGKGRPRHAPAAMGSWRLPPSPLFFLSCHRPLPWRGPFHLISSPEPNNCCMDSECKFLLFRVVSWCFALYVNLKINASNHPSFLINPPPDCCTAPFLSPNP